MTTPDGSLPEETWSPTLAPGAQPDLQAILHEARTFTSEGRYEEALQRFLWFHHHALEFGPSFLGVRLSFALSYWAELGQRYPKAKQALIETRDRGAKELTAGHGDFALFMEVDAINHALDDNSATEPLFKTMASVNPALAHKCYRLIEERLVERGEYETCLDYIGDPQTGFESIRGLFETTQKLSDSIPASQQSQIRDHNTRTFVTDTRRLIEILVATKHQAEAERIRDQAVATLNDPQLQSAVTDAGERIQRRSQKAAASAPATPQK